MEKLICLVFYLELLSQADNITPLGTWKRYCPVISPRYCSVTLRAHCSDQHFPFLLLPAAPALTNLGSAALADAMLERDPC